MHEPVPVQGSRCEARFWRVSGCSQCSLRVRGFSEPLALRPVAAVGLHFPVQGRQQRPAALHVGSDAPTWLALAKALTTSEVSEFVRSKEGRTAQPSLVVRPHMARIGPDRRHGHRRPHIPARRLSSSRAGEKQSPYHGWRESRGPSDTAGVIRAPISVTATVSLGCRFGTLSITAAVLLSRTTIYYMA